jgi:hypothetical protein
VNTELLDRHCKDRRLSHIIKIKGKPHRNYKKDFFTELLNGPYWSHFLTKIIAYFLSEDRQKKGDKFLIEVNISQQHEGGNKLC